MDYIIFNNDGEYDMSEHFTHLVGCGPDYTLCGITLDGDLQTAGSFRYESKKYLTCPDCVSIVKICRDRFIFYRKGN